MPNPNPNATPNYTVGKAVAVSVGGSLAFVMSGNCDREVNAVTVTNSQSGGYQQVKAGSKKASGSLELAYNGDSPPAISEGQEAQIIIDTIGYEITESIEDVTYGTPTPTPTAPSGRLITMTALITKVSDKWKADSDYSWSIDYQSSGAYTAVDTATGASTTT